MPKLTDRVRAAELRDFADPKAWLRHDGNRWTRIDPEQAEPGDMVVYHALVDPTPCPPLAAGEARESLNRAWRDA